MYHRKGNSKDQGPIVPNSGYFSSCPNTMLTKKMLLTKSRCPYQWNLWINIAKLLNVSIEEAKWSTQDKSGFAALVDCVVANATP